MKPTYQFPGVWVLSIIFLCFTLGGCEKLGKASVQDYVSEADSAISNENWPAAVISLKSAIQLEPKNPALRIRLAKVYLHMEDGASAEKELVVASSSESVSENLQPLLASSYLLQAKYQDLIEFAVDQNGSATDQAEVYGLKGLAGLELGEVDEALIFLYKGLEYDANNITIQAGLAQATAIQGDLQEAEARLNALLTEHPTNAQILSLQGDVYRYQGKLKEAESAYSRAIEAQYTGTRERINRIFVRVNLSDFEGAYKDIRFLRNRFPDLVLLDYAEGIINYHQANYKQATESFTKVLAKSRNYLPGIFYLGASYYMQGQDDSALQQLEQFIAKVPGDINAVKMVASIKLRKGEFDEAEKLLRQLVQLYPKDTESLSLLATALMQKNEIAEGVSYLEKVVELNPDSPSARMGLGIGLLSKGETEAGSQQLQKARQLDPDISIDVEKVIFLHLRNRAFDDAIAVARANYSEHMDDPQAAFLLGISLFANGEKTEAKEVLKKALKIDPGHLNSLQTLATQAVQNNDIEEARKWFQETLKYHPGDLNSLRGLALIAGMQGKESEMISLLKKAVDENPGDLTPRLSLARYYSKTNQPEKVVEVLKDVHYTQRDDPNVLAILGESQLAVGNYQEAISNLSALSSRAPGNVWSRYLLAQAYNGAGEGKRYETELEEVLKLDKDHFPARFNLVRYQLLLNNLDSAEKNLQLLSPSDQEEKEATYVLKGKYSELKGDSSQAEKLYSQAIDLKPSNINLLNLENVLWNSDQKEKAYSLLKEWLAQHPKDQLTQTRLALRYNSDGDSDNARAAFTNIVKDYPDHVIALNNLAWLLKESNSRQALSYAEKAFKLAPQSDEVAHTLSVILTEKDSDRALQLINRALDTKPENPSYRFQKAQLLYLLKRYAEAKSSLKKLLEEHQDFPERQKAEEIYQKVRGLAL